jgi:hypothetical protein
MENEWPNIEGMPEWLIRTMQSVGLIKIETITLSNEWKNKL